MSKAKLFLVCVLSALSILACGLGPTVNNTGLPALTVTPIVSPYKEHRAIAACVDTTSDYSSQTFHAFNMLLARWLDADTTVNQGGFTFYLTAISQNTTSPAATPIVIRVPAVPTDPQPPSYVSPKPTGNAFQDAQNKTKAQQAYQQQVAQYEQTLTRLHAKLAQLQNQVKVQTDALRALPFAPSGASSSAALWDCLQLASSRFQQEANAQHWIIIGTSLGMPPVEQSGLYLFASHMRFQYTLCTQSDGCAAVKAAWTRFLLVSGAVQVDFFDSAASNALTFSPF